MSYTFQKIEYKDLNSKQKENYNYHKISAVLADYGFSCMWLNDDWQGADFIACHIDGENFIKVQLKGRLTLDEKYAGKSIYIAFNYLGQWYLYPHDEVRDTILAMGMIANSKSWKEGKAYSWKHISSQLLEALSDYAI